MAMVEKTVTSGMAWRPVSHRVSQSLTFSKHPVYPKKVFSNLKLVGLINYLNIAYVLAFNVLHLRLLVIFSKNLSWEFPSVIS